jgi:D-3-phosphoglycerate dehydrogenase / 2-oxoglutarate reductase
MFAPHVGNEEPWLADVAAALPAQTELVVLEPHRPFEPQFKDVRVVIDHGGNATREMIDAGAAAGVRLWQVHGTGLDYDKVKYILAKGIPVANTPGTFSAIALAEHALLLMLCFAKNLREMEDNVHAGKMYKPLNDELAGATLGLIGFGASAKELARRAHALGMGIRAIDVVDLTDGEIEEFALDWFGAPSQLPRLLQESDYVSIHAPLTRSTHHMVDADGLALMKPTAVVINVARAAIVDERALIAALREGRLRGAGVDTYSQEPPMLDNPLFGLKNVFATPHVAGGTYGTSKRRAAVCAENVSRVAKGFPPLYEVTVLNGD